MKKHTLVSLPVFVLGILVCCSLRVLAQEQGPIHIQTPAPGQNLGGVVSVTGTSLIDGFVYYELSFTYTGSSVETWFLIHSSDQPVTDGELAAWDTTSLANGVYQLRLRVYQQDGAYQDDIVENLNIGLSVDPSPTPVVAAVATVVVPTSPPAAMFSPTVTVTAFPTPTDLPVNPVVVQERRVYFNLGLGGLVALGAFIFFGLIIFLRSKSY
ncbi:MAG: hypothetical protein JXA13_16445 [Anaerolineales bacterium]|nr:hypothetical protein [Anaerolineales bacterium]